MPLRPRIIVICDRQEPIIFPTAIPLDSKPLSLYIPDIRLRNISGREVPMETTVNPIIKSEIPNFLAILIDLPTAISEENIRAIIPKKTVATA